MRIIILLFSFLLVFLKPAHSQWELVWENTKYGLYGISAPDSLHIWAVGDSGKVLHSNDGGENWQFQETGIKHRLIDVVFLDSLQGWAIGDSSTIIQTIDGGGSWASLRTDSLVHLKQIYIFKNDSIAWSFGSIIGMQHRGALLKSTNYGMDWKYFPLKDYEYFHSSDVHFLSGESGWLHTEAPIIFTKDACASFNEVNYLDYFLGGADAICYTDTLTGFLGLTDYSSGVKHSFIRTTDGGNSWILINEWSIGRIYFLNSNLGWALGRHGGIYSTQDSGENWTFESEQGVSWVSDIDFASPKAGFTCGSYIIDFYRKRGEIHRYIPIPDGIKKNENLIPYNLTLQNYPNPFNSSTIINIKLPHNGFYSLIIYNVTGSRVKDVVVKKSLIRGEYKYIWNGLNNDDQLLSSGLYFIVLKDNTNLLTVSKALLVK